MTLESVVLEIVANGGLAEDVNPRVLQQGSWLTLDNVAIDKGGAFRKRQGYARSTTYTDRPYPEFSAPLYLGSHGDTLYQFSVQMGGPYSALGAGALLCVQDLFGNWAAKDDVSPFVARRSVGLRSHREFNGGAVVHCVNNRYTIGCLYNDDGAEPGALPIVLRGTDVATGAVVQDDLVIGYLEPGLSYLLGYTFKACATGAYVAVLHNSNGGVTLTVYSPATKTFATTQLVATVSAGLTRPSIWRVDNDRVVIAYNDNDQLKVREWRIWAVGTVLPVAPAYSLTESGTIHEIEVCSENEDDSGGGSSRVYVTYTVATGEAVGVTRTLALTYATMALAWGPVTLDTEMWTYVTNVWASKRLWSVGRDQPAGSVDDALIFVSQTDSTGANLSEQILSSGIAPASRPFTLRGRAYLPVIARGTGGGGPPYTGAVVELSVIANADLSPSREPARLVGTFAVEEWGTFKFGGVFTCSKPSTFDDVCFAAPVFTGVESTGIDIIRFRPVGNTWPLPTTQAQGLAVIPGALTSYFDGQGVFEAGFLEPPLILRATQAESIGGLAAGTYLWVAAWLYEDAAGNQHWSQPSTPFSYEVTADGTKVTLEIATDRIGRRDRDVDGEERKVRLIVYRTKADASSPFYRVTTPTIENIAATDLYNGPVLNDRFKERILFIDTVPDGTVQTNAFGLLPFDLAGNAAGVLDCDPPPPSLFALNHKNRVWLVSGDNPRAVWFSRELKQNEAPCWSRVLQFFISDTTEEITALAPLGDKVLVFTKTRIYFVAGDGPDDTGQGGLPFQGPYLVSDTVGCSAPNSVVAYEGGVVFAMRSGRFENEPSEVVLYQINGAMQIQRISGPVEDSLRDFNTFCGSWVDPARGWLGFGLRRGYYEDQDDPSVHLVWSYWENKWVRWTTPNVRVAASHLHRGEHVWSATNDWLFGGFEHGNAYVETRGTYEDPEYINTAQWITMRLRTPWLRAGQIAGYSRVRRVQVFGDAPDGYLFNLDLAIDYEHRETGGNTYTFPISSFQHRTYPLVRVEAIPGIQKSQAFRLTVSDSPIPETTANAGLTLSAISLEIAGKKGLSKLAKTSRAREPS